MKNLFLIILISGFIAFASCGGDDNSNSKNDTTATLKKDSVAEKPAYMVDVKEIQAQNMLSITTTVKIDDIASEMGKIYGELMMFVSERGFSIIAPPVCIWNKWSPNDDNEMECGVIVKEEAEGYDNIVAKKTYAGKAAMLVHKGAYTESHPSWEFLMNYVKENNLEMNGAPWEEYITDPTKEPDTSKWITNFYLPIK